MEFKKTYLIKERDFIDYILFLNRFKSLLYSFVCIIIFSLALLFFSDFSDNLYRFIIWIAITGTIIILIRNWPYKFKAKSMYKSSNLANTAFELTINDSFVKIKYNDRDSETSWNDLNKTDESKRAYYIYLSKSKVIFIHKHLLDQQEELVLRQLINDNLDAKKNKLKKR